MKYILHEKINIKEEAINMLYQTISNMDKQIEEITFNSEKDMTRDKRYPDLLEFHKLSNRDMRELIKDNNQIVNLSLDTYYDDFIGSSTVLDNISRNLDVFDINDASNEEIKDALISDLINERKKSNEDFTFDDFNLEELIKTIKNIEFQDESRWEIISLYTNDDEVERLKVTWIKLQDIILKNFPIIEDRFTKEVEKLKGKDISSYINETFESFLGKESINLIENLDSLHIFIDLSKIFQLSIEVALNKKTMVSSLGIVANDAYYERDNTYKKEDLFDKFKAIGEKTRFNVILELLNGPHYVKELAEKLGLTSATLSHHLQQLINAKLIKANIVENKTYYALNKQGFKEFNDLFTSLIKELEGGD